MYSSVCFIFIAGKGGIQVERREQNFACFQTQMWNALIMHNKSNLLTNIF